MHISLTPELESKVKQKVKSGFYNNASEVIREALRYMDKNEELLEHLKLEQLAVPLLREAIEYCESIKDYVSREVFSNILESEEEHIDWLETQLELIEKVGLPNYLQSQM